MTSVSRDGGDGVPGMTSVCQDVQRDAAVGSELSNTNENSLASSKPGDVDSARRRRPLLSVVQKSLASRSPLRRGSDGTEPGGVRPGVGKAATERKDPAADGATGVAEAAAGDSGTKLSLPSRRSRSRDRRGSMSIIDSVFHRRRRRRPSLTTPGLRDSSDSEHSAAELPASTATGADPASSAVAAQTWRSETCRRLLSDETASTSSTAERDNVDHQPRQRSGSGSSSWQRKLRHRINDISLFNKANNRGTEAIDIA